MASNIQAHVLRFTTDTKIDFLQDFLSSFEFDNEMLKYINRQIGISQIAKTKNDLAEDFIREYRQKDYNREIYENVLIKAIFGKNRNWCAIKYGNISSIPICNNLSSLLYEEGKEDFYGPFEDHNGYWYIRPVFTSHYERDENNEVGNYKVRCLFIMNIKDNFLSIYWNGFYLHPNKNSVVDEENRSQFPYWDYIPTVLREFEIKTASNLEYINYSDLILYKMMDEYDEKEDFEWLHLKIRAMANGVKLNARSGVIQDIETSGIKYLAETIRKDMSLELSSRYSYILPDETHFDKHILKTLIRNFGALSYEFQLKESSRVILRIHSFFGSGQPKQDIFPHIHVYSDIHIYEQMEFIKREHSKWMI